MPHLCANCWSHLWKKETCNVNITATDSQLNRAWEPTSRELWDVAAMLEGTAVNEKRLRLWEMCAVDWKMWRKHQEENGIHHETLTKEVRGRCFEEKKERNGGSAWDSHKKWEGVNIVWRVQSTSNLTSEFQLTKSCQVHQNFGSSWTGWLLVLMRLIKSFVCWI